MSEFVYRGEKIIGADEPITLENNTDASLDVSIGIGVIFRKSGLYRVSVDNKHTSIEIIEPEQKKGKWIDNRDVSWMCSECGRWIDVLQGDADMNFCPNCGTDMRGK